MLRMRGYPGIRKPARIAITAKLSDRRRCGGCVPYSRVQDASKTTQGPRSAWVSLAESESPRAYQRNTYQQKRGDEATHGKTPQTDCNAKYGRYIVKSTSKTTFGTSRIMRDVSGERAVTAGRVTTIAPATSSPTQPL